MNSTCSRGANRSCNSSTPKCRSALPRYSTIKPQVDEPIFNNLPPPRYSTIFVRRAGHQAHIRNRTTNTPWATLHVVGRQSQTPQNAAQVFGGDKVKGSVKLNLENGHIVHSITVSLKGRIITGASDGGDYTFLDHPLTIWTKCSGDPRVPGASESMDKKFDGKLVGNYTWSFSFPFPTHVTSIPSTPQTETRICDDASRLIAVPQSFLENGISANVEYLLSLDIVHGCLRTHNSTKIFLTYLPEMKPGPPSLLRQTAYRQRSPLASPERDPDGWLTLPTPELRGKILRQSTVQIACKLSLAKPLSYTRGTVIPCYLSIFGLEGQALDLMSSPIMPDVRLVRRIEYFKNPATALDPASKKNSVVTEKDDVSRAIFWKPAASPNSCGFAENTRYLEGEIHLSKYLQPSCSFKPFTIEYAIEMRSFNSDVFEQESNSSSEAIISQAITITTLQGDGTPIRYRERNSLKDLSEKRRIG